MEHEEQVNQAAVDEFVAGAAGATAADVRRVIQRLGDQINDREPHAVYRGQRVNAATLAATQERLAQLLNERGQGCFLCSFGAWPRAAACAHE